MRRRIAFESFVQDLRFALRILGRQKVWTLVAVFTLALGIGANTAVFSVVNDLLLDPLRYPNAERLLLISRLNASSGFEVTPTRKLLDSWKSMRTLEAVEGVSGADVTMTGRGEPETLHATMISPDFVKFAGARMLAGRSFHPDEVKGKGHPVAVLSERMWMSRFGGAADVIGKTIVLDGVVRTVIGVMEGSVRTSSYSARKPDIWLPLAADIPFLSGPVVGRLAPGASSTAAQKELAAIADAVARESGSLGGMAFDIAVRSPGSKGQTRQSVMMLAGAVCLLLLIACANVAHLLLARGATREREMAIRAALGAGRSRIVRQLLTESLLLSAAGCIAGIGLGMLALRAIVSLRPPSMEELANVHVDARVLTVTVLISLVTALIFGLIAGLQGRNARSSHALRSANGSTSDRSRHRFRSALVITESAMSVVLLVSATLLIRTVVNLHNVNPGYEPENLYAMSIDLPEARYPGPENRKAYSDRLLDEGRRLPGVIDATVASSVPTRSGVIMGEWVAEGNTAPGRPNDAGFTAMNSVRANYFAAMRMPLVAGNTFEGGADKRNEVIVSASLARELWGNANAVGLRFRMTPSASTGSEPAPFNTVVGVVNDANILGLRDEGKIRAVYFPEGNTPESTMSLIVRVRDGVTPHEAMRALALRLDPAMAPPAILKVTDLLTDSIASQRFLMTLLTLFACAAVLLSAVGLYGVVSFVVSQSTREIGIRVALGAARKDVASLVMRQGVLLSTVGLVIGLVGSAWGTRLLQQSLFGVTPTDVMSYVVHPCCAPFASSRWLQSKATETDEAAGWNAPAGSQ
jgi:putative ABC transport system permease protein